MKRVLKIILAAIGLSAIGLPLGGAALAAEGTSSSAVIIFDDAAHQAQLIIPTPACPASQPDCQWKFFLNEPKLSVDVGTVYGTSGTLTIDYPSGFCGVIQADAYVGPPWVPKRGFQHTIEDCAPPDTTMTTGQPPPPATSANTAPPPVFGSVSATSAPPPAGPSGAPQVSSSNDAPATSPVSDQPAQLPFTGANLEPILLIGWTLVAFGLYLLTSGESKRRMGRRIGDCPWPTVPKRHRSSGWSRNN